MFGGRMPPRIGGVGVSGGMSATAANTFTAAGTASVTATLPGGAVGTPRKIRASGSVSGAVTLQYANAQELTVSVNPNAPYTELDIPPQAFPSKTGEVTVTLTADGAGTIRAIVDFSP